MLKLNWDTRELIVESLLCKLNTQQSESSNGEKKVSILASGEENGGERRKKFANYNLMPRSVEVEQAQQNTGEKPWNFVSFFYCYSCWCVCFYSLAVELFFLFLSFEIMLFYTVSVHCSPTLCMFTFSAGKLPSSKKHKEKRHLTNSNKKKNQF